MDVRCDNEHKKEQRRWWRNVRLPCKSRWKTRHCTKPAKEEQPSSGPGESWSDICLYFSKIAQHFRKFSLGTRKRPSERNLSSGQATGYVQLPQTEVLRRHRDSPDGLGKPERASHRINCLPTQERFKADFSDLLLWTIAIDGRPIRSSELPLVSSFSASSILRSEEQPKLLIAPASKLQTSIASTG